MRGRLAIWLLGLAVIAAFIGCSNASLEALDAPSQFTVSSTTDYDPVVKIVLPGGHGMCSGAFISPRAVLTAAHCTLTAGSYRIVAKFGQFTATGVRNLGPGTVDDPNDISIIYFDTAVADPSAGQTMPIGANVRSLDRVRLVGFGCNDLDSRRGSGVKRTGTNQVYQVSEHIELVTPLTDTTTRGLVGPENRAGACFGDSGSPLLRQTDRYFEVVGVGHAGSWDDEYLYSYYADLGRTANWDFLSDLDAELSLGIMNPCAEGSQASFCGPEGADLGIMGFLKRIWTWFKLLIF